MTKEMEKIESKNNLFPFTINKDIDTWIPQEKRESFQKCFAYLRKRLQIKQTRKTYIDSILKKCKTRFFKAINDCLNQCVKVNIKNLPQTFITNISIEYNKYFLGLTAKIHIIFLTYSKMQKWMNLLKIIATREKKITSNIFIIVRFQIYIYYISKVEDIKEKLNILKIILDSKCFYYIDSFLKIS